MRGRVVEKDLVPNSMEIMEHPEVKKAIDHLKGKDARVNDDYIQKVFNVDYFDENNETEVADVEQTQTYVELSDEAQLRIISTRGTSGNERLNVAAIYRGEKDGIPRVFTTAFEKGTIKYEVDRAYDEEQFKLPEDKGDIEPYVAYLDCVFGGSCCTLSGKKYRWCGAGCGSGTPVNSLDTCCKWHDGCYGDYGSYPKRCLCDEVLIACADGTGVDGAGILISAFYAKEFVKGC